MAVGKHQAELHAANCFPERFAQPTAGKSVTDVIGHPRAAGRERRELVTVFPVREGAFNCTIHEAHGTFHLLPDAPPPQRQEAKKPHHNFKFFT